MARKGTVEASQAQQPTGSIQPRGQNSLRREEAQNGGGSGDGSPTVADAENLSFSSEQIAERAYQIFEREGRKDGKDMDHWLQAERELKEERKRAQGNAATDGNVAGAARGPAASAPGGNSGMRSNRPDEAPRSARRHQAPAA
jgi:hypothetical protein